VLGTQETFCIVIAGLLKRDSFDLLLPEFGKPWVIHLRETCCCSRNLCTWRPNTVYKDRSVRRHHSSLRDWSEDDDDDDDELEPSAALGAIALHVAATAAARGKISPIMDVLDSMEWLPAAPKSDASKKPRGRTAAPQKRTQPAPPEPAQKRKRTEPAAKDLLPPKVKKVVKRQATGVDG
jgi:hypothetical protein